MTTTVQAPAVARTRAELQELLGRFRGSGPDGLRTSTTVGPTVLVPTMGALHDGHASLIRTARERANQGTVVVSIFVNPLQFGEGEDLDRYPRTFDADLEVCAREGADVVFAPGVDEVYPGGDPAVTVDPGPLAERLEGAVRPGHFRGVLTVVAKLFGLVRPDVAVFGEKDYQQLVLIRRMVADLCLTGSDGPLEILGGPTDREHDGLARSSRNVYLGTEDRRRAAALHRVLLAAREGATYGVDSALAAARAELRRSDGVDLDYLTVLGTDLDELPADVSPGTPARALIAARLGAARLGATRLIDNLALTIGDRPSQGDN